jgi:DNA-binding SARP family transcriptional activator
VRVFGPLRIEKDGVQPPGVGKAQRRPLELLALLAAHGNQPQDAQGVIDTLWPSLDANAPRQSLDMALSRLRKLLGDPAAVLCTQGQVRLDPQRVWTDVAAFEALAQAADAGDAMAPWQALALYRDALLGTAPLEGRLLAQRHRLAQRVCELALDGADRLAACGATQQAERLLQRAIDREPLCERLYRRLMQLLLAQGEHAEAARTGRRCEQLLRAALHVPLAAPTRALADLAVGALHPPWIGGEGSPIGERSVASPRP